LFNCPLSPEKADKLVEHLALNRDSYAIDVGCGEGEFFIRVAERYKIVGIGLDKNSDLIEVANNKVKTRIPSQDVSFVCQDAKSFAWENQKADLIICIGSEFIFGGYRQALQCLSNSLIDSGKLLIGTVFWKKEPDSEYLSLMNGENPHFDYLTTVEIGIEQGFIPLYLCRSNDDEWDDFESQHAQKQYLAALHNGSKQAFERIQRWQRGYLRWGHETMGFVFVLFQKRPI
jgi:cyclopropane fatty-acyl-phospholipid synthase-like methyltransferase